jgi:hypothetical protein
LPSPFFVIYFTHAAAEKRTYGSSILSSGWRQAITCPFDKNEWHNTESGPLFGHISLFLISAAILMLVIYFFFKNIIKIK